MANNGPNPVLLVRDHLPAHIAELEDEALKLAVRLRELNEQIVTARTLLAVILALPVPEPPAPGPTG